MQKPIETGAIQESFDISSLDKGIYFITISNELSTYTTKLTKN
jgi:hypothetical protein